MAELLETRIMQIIQTTLRDKNNLDELSIGPNDSMDSVECWDSLAFMTVFLAINEEFELDPDFDDAIHYTSVQSLTDYLSKKAA